LGVGLTTPPLKNKLLRDLKKATVAFEEGQGPHRAVEPVMVMMMVSKSGFLLFRIC
jgi:hypothetical protein